MKYTFSHLMSEIEDIFIKNILIFLLSYSTISALKIKSHFGHAIFFQFIEISRLH